MHLLEETLHVERGAGEDHQTAVIGLSDRTFVTEQNCGRLCDGVVKVLIETKTLGRGRVKCSSCAGSSDGAKEFELANVLTSLGHSCSKPHLGACRDLLVVKEGHHVLPQLEAAGPSS